MQNKVSFATNVCKDVRKDGIANFQIWVKDCWEQVASVLRYPSYQRNQTGEILSETNYCGTGNVLNVADTNWDSK